MARKPSVNQRPRRAGFTPPVARTSTNRLGRNDNAMKPSNTSSPSATGAKFSVLLARRCCTNSAAGIDVLPNHHGV